MAEAKTHKIRLRSAPAGLAYPQGRWFEVSAEELKRLKAYKVVPKSVLRTGDANKIRNASIPLNIETYEEFEAEQKSAK